MEIKIINSKNKNLITNDNGESLTIPIDVYLSNTDLSFSQTKDKFYGKNKIHILCMIRDILGGKGRVYYDKIK